MSGDGGEGGGAAAAPGLSWVEVDRQIERNRAQTAVLVVGVVAWLLAVVLFAALRLHNLWLPLALVAGLVVARVSMVWMGGEGSILRHTSARELGTADPDHRAVWVAVEELRERAGLPRPGLFVIETGALNAFAVGRSPEVAAIAVTRGLVKTLARDELEGVLAHELAHIRNLDTRFAMLIVALTGAAVQGAQQSRLGGFGRGVGAGVGLVVAPVVALVVRMGLSRRRELLADAGAAALTRSPLGLARALEKIARAPHAYLGKDFATRQLFIADPRGVAAGWLDRLLSSHPPVDERVRALRAMVA